MPLKTADDVHARTMTYWATATNICGDPRSDRHGRADTTCVACCAKNRTDPEAGPIVCLRWEMVGEFQEIFELQRFPLDAQVWCPALPRAAPGLSVGEVVRRPRTLLYYNTRH